MQENRRIKYTFPPLKAEKDCVKNDCFYRIIVLLFMSFRVIYVHTERDKYTLKGARINVKNKIRY